MGNTFLCCLLAEVHGDGSFVLHHLPLAGKRAVISHVIKRQMFKVLSSVFHRNSAIYSLLVNELSQEVAVVNTCSNDFRNC